jgi:MinD-like ATPase involved in chromosome partitioning or flagellar assembly
MQLEQEIDEPKRKPKSKLQLDRERANGILEAISRVTAETRQNLNIVEQGAAQRTRANEQHSAADQPASRISQAIRELADGLNKSFERAREFVREKLSEIIKTSHSKGHDMGR